MLDGRRFRGAKGRKNMSFKKYLYNFFFNTSLFSYDLSKKISLGRIGVSLYSEDYIHIKTSICSKYKTKNTFSYSNQEHLKHLLNEIDRQFPKKFIRRYQLLLAIPDTTTKEEMNDYKDIIKNHKQFRHTLFFTHSICVISNYEINSKSIYIYKLKNSYFGCSGFYGSQISKSIQLNSISNIDTCITTIINEELKELPHTLEKGVTSDGKKLKDLWTCSSIENIYISTDEQIDCDVSIYKSIIRKSFKPNIILDGMFKYCKYSDALDYELLLK